MESIYWRYHYSIRPYKFITLLFFLGFISLVRSQSNLSEKDEIAKFLTDDFVSLLQKVKDYGELKNANSNLSNAIASELDNLDIAINPSAVIEYDKTTTQGQDVVISDQLLPFLINYAGRETGKPVLTIECILEKPSDFHIYFRSSGIINLDNQLSKAIFKKVNNDLELRRMSFENKLDNECGINEDEVQSDAFVRSSENESSTDRSNLKLRNSLPRITIREATVVNGQAIIYGFILNHEKNGILIDLENNSSVNISDIDGFFVLNKLLKGSGHQELQLKYQYGEKFILDRKLLFLKP